MNLFENEKVAVRRFTSDDWVDVLEMAQTNHASEFAGCDHQWPTDEGTVKDITNYFGTNDSMYAVVAKDINRVVTFVNFNGVTDENYLDIGHVMNLNYAGKGYEYEGLKLLCNHAFDTMGISGICAYWAKDDKVKIDPLMKLGMKIVETSQSNYFDGRDGTYIACTLKASKDEFLKAIK